MSGPEPLVATEPKQAAAGPYFTVEVLANLAGTALEPADGTALNALMDRARDAAIAVLDGTARPGLSAELDASIRDVIAIREEMAGMLNRPFGLVELRAQLRGAIDRLRTAFQIIEKEFGNGQ